MVEDVDDFQRDRLGPDDMHDVIEAPADGGVDVAECARLGIGVEVRDPEIRVHDVKARGRAVDEEIEQLCAPAHLLVGVGALQSCPDTRRDLAHQFDLVRAPVARFAHCV